MKKTNINSNKYIEDMKIELESFKLFSMEVNFNISKLLNGKTALFKAKNQNIVKTFTYEEINEESLEIIKKQIDYLIQEFKYLQTKNYSQINTQNEFDERDEIILEQSRRINNLKRNQNSNNLDNQNMNSANSMESSLNIPKNDKSDSYLRLSSNNQIIKINSNFEYENQQKIENNTQNKNNFIQIHNSISDLQNSINDDKNQINNFKQNYDQNVENKRQIKQQYDQSQIFPKTIKKSQYEYQNKQTKINTNVTNVIRTELNKMQSNFNQISSSQNINQQKQEILNLNQKSIDIDFQDCKNLIHKLTSANELLKLELSKKLMDIEILKSVQYSTISNPSIINEENTQPTTQFVYSDQPTIELENDLVLMKLEHNNLNSKYDTIKNEMLILEDNNNKLKLLNQDMKNEHEELNINQNALVLEKDQLLDKLNDLTTKNNTLNHQNEKQNFENNSLISRIEVQKQDLSNLSQEVSKLTNGLNKSKKRHKDQNNRIEELELNLVHQYDEISSKIRSELHFQFEKKSRLVEQKKKVLSTENKDMKLKIDELIQKLNLSNNNVKSLESEKIKLNSKISTQNDRIANLIQQVNIIQDDYDKLKIDYEAIEIKNKEFEKQLKNYELTIHKLEEEIEEKINSEELRQKLDIQKITNEKFDEVFLNLNNKMDKLNNQNKSLIDITTKYLDTNENQDIDLGVLSISKNYDQKSIFSFNNKNEIELNSIKIDHNEQNVLKENLKCIEEYPRDQYKNEQNNINVMFNELNNLLSIILKFLQMQNVELHGIIFAFLNTILSSGIEEQIVIAKRIKLKLTEEISIFDFNLRNFNLQTMTLIQIKMLWESLRTNLTVQINRFMEAIDAYVLACNHTPKLRIELSTSRDKLHHFNMDSSDKDYSKYEQNQNDDTHYRNIKLMDLNDFTI